VFFSREGGLLAFGRVIGDFFDYEIWNVHSQKRLLKGTLPGWCWGKDDILRHFQITEFGLSTMKLADQIDQNWDAVLPQCYPAVFWGGSLTVVDAVGITSDGKTLFRTPSRSENTIEVWDVAKAECRKLTASVPRLTFHLTPSPDANLLVLRGIGAPESEETIWQKVRRWLRLTDWKADLANAMSENSWLLDIQTGQRLAHFPKARSATFSRSGELLTVLYEEKTEFWDIPLRRPWRKIVALCAAAFLSVMFLPTAWRVLRRSPPWNSPAGQSPASSAP
jgi:hypothetical protein